ncbi:UNKNOWN [Stylonychia lemnae]|uniref:Uncharacterized protein n=1 Tax=Stylonychia lemnae TaxID=5949 RepID=A0A078AZT6_STYLE|nr:UNKNOWN [Stylonychia lemnae]|eukprot:CDW86308.1 UNKNOWN [Stylonychia lemnae]
MSNLSPPKRRASVRMVMTRKQSFANRSLSNSRLVNYKPTDDSVISLKGFFTKIGNITRKTGEEEEYFDYKLFQTLVNKLDQNKEIMQNNYNLLALMSPRQAAKKPTTFTNGKEDASDLRQSQDSMTQIKQQSINDTLKDLQKLQHKQGTIISRIDVIDKLQVRMIKQQSKKQFVDASTQTYGNNIEEDILRKIEQKYQKELSQMELILMGERKFREKEFAGNFERQMEALKFQVTIEANVKVDPLKSDKLSENFKEKTLKFLQGNKNLLNHLFIDKDRLLNNDIKQIEGILQEKPNINQKSQYALMKSTGPSPLISINRGISPNQTIDIHNNSSKELYSKLPPLNPKVLLQKKINNPNSTINIDYKTNLFDNFNNRSSSQNAIARINQQSPIQMVTDLTRGQPIGKMIDFKNQSQHKREISLTNMISESKLSIQIASKVLNYSPENQSQNHSPRAVGTRSNNQKQKQINVLQMSDTLLNDKGIKLKIDVVRVNENLFSINMDKHLTRQLNIDQVQYYTKFRRMMIQFEEFQSASFNLDDIFLNEIEFLKTKAQEQLKFREVFEILKLLSKNIDSLFEIYVSFNLLQMTKITEVNKMRLYNFIKIFQSILGFTETPKFGKDHLTVEFYNSARLYAKDMPGNISLSQPTRVYIEGSQQLEQFTVNIEPFQMIKNICRIKDELSSKDYQDVLDNYRVKTKQLFNKLISEQLDKNSQTLSFISNYISLIIIEILRFFTSARVFKDKVNILKPGMTLKQLENTQVGKKNSVQGSGEKNINFSDTHYNYRNHGITPPRTRISFEMDKVSGSSVRMGSSPVRSDVPTSTNKQQKYTKFQFTKESQGTSKNLLKSAQQNAQHFKSHDYGDEQNEDAFPQPSFQSMTKVFRWVNRVKKRIEDRHNLIVDNVRVQEHKFEFKEMCEIILTSLDNKALFLKDGRLETIEEDDLTMSFDEFCNSLLIIGHLYHKKLALYQEFTLKESIDDFFHHLLNRFGIDSNPLYRKRLEKLMKLNFIGNYSESVKTSIGSKDDIPGSIKEKKIGETGVEEKETFGQILKRLKAEKLKQHQDQTKE